MQVGETVRRFRERRGLSIRQMEERCGLTRGYLSRIESGRRVPSWAALEAIGAAWEMTPVVHFAARQPDRPDVEAWSRLDPESRLWRLNAGAVPALAALARELGEDVAADGCAAAVLQGQYVGVETLEVVVRDDDAVVEVLVDVLRRWWAFYQQMSVEEFRSLQRSSWVMRDVDVEVRLVTALPPTVPIAMDAVTVRAVTLPHLLATDPVVAAALGQVADTDAATA